MNEGACMVRVAEDMWRLAQGKDETPGRTMWTVEGNGCKWPGY